MKLFDSTKKKVVAGATAVVLVSGAGVGFAATDVGSQLQAWYDGKFSETVNASYQEGEDYARNKLPEIEEKYNNRKGGASESIGISQKSNVNRVSSEIEDAKQDHLEGVESTKEELLESAGMKFYQEFVNGKAEIEKYTQQGKNYIKKDLPVFMEGEGNSAIEELEGELDDVKDEAVSELEEAIKAAKGELQDDLDDRGDNLTYNFESQINHAIEDLRKETGDLINTLLNEQKELIKEAADEKESEAINALDDVVAGVNK